MFEEMDKDLRTVEEEKINKDFFKTDEFQTILFLALQQLQTTHDAEKLKALADGLAKGALVEFSTETRKELFFRILRDMAPDELKVLKYLAPKKPGVPNAPYFRPQLNDEDLERLGVLQRLEAKGLVSMSLKSEMKISAPRYANQWTPSDAEREIKKALETPPSRYFSISDLGVAFLRFFSEFTEHK